jgi:crotonobetainyl-CoA:carnitine CoA-transferase CaiB-like acyl-CoA transferase
MTVPYLHEVYGAGAPKRQGLQHPSIAPYGAYTCLDEKSVVISIQNEREWQQFCTVFLGTPALLNDIRYSSNTQRVKHRRELDLLISSVFESMSSDDAMQLLTNANTAFGRVNTVADFALHAALRTWPMNLPEQNDVQLVAPPVRTPWDSHRYSEAPSIGQHTKQLREEFDPVLADFATSSHVADSI